MRLGRLRAGWGVVALWVVAGLGCGEEEAPVGDDGTAVLAQATQRQFGDGFDATAVVAEVDGQPIRVGDLALCRELAPAWPLRRCLDELVEVRAMDGRATEADRAHPLLAEARSAALASALLRETIDLQLSGAALSEQAIQAFQADPTNRVYFSRPPLRQTSHLLVRGPNGGPNAESQALAQRIQAETTWPETATVADLEAVRASWAEAGRTAGVDLRVERHFVVQADNAPERALPSIAPVVQPFADALFALERPGAISTPLETEFGTHFILFEVEFPALAIPPDEAEAVARHELGQRQRSEALGRLREQLLERADVVRHEAVDLFRLSDEQLIRERSSSMREQFGPQVP